MSTLSVEQHAVDVIVRALQAGWPAVPNEAGVLTQVQVFAIADVLAPVVGRLIIERDNARGGRERAHPRGPHERRRAGRAAC